MNTNIFRASALVLAFLPGAGVLAAPVTAAPVAAGAVSASVWVPGNGQLPALSPLPAGQPFTFAVLGDNRGSGNGKLRPVFVEMLEAVRAEHPVFILHTGDMISGYSAGEKALRRQWKAYIEGVKLADAPVFHVPGNHDISDAMSARVYHELWGESRYAFDYGGARFIGLDTETTENRLGEEQEAWLAGQLESAAGKRVFLFFHEPLYPVDGHRGSSLDKYPKDRDRLHALFVKYNDRIKGVYMGHEHLYNYQLIDGIASPGAAARPCTRSPRTGDSTTAWSCG
jgi:3',5'-cyclic AMP phosphodiesterase CpdA